MGVTVSIAPDLADRLANHLGQGPDEQLAFLLARWTGDEARIVDLQPIAATSLEFQTPWHLSLSDAARAEVIKWAHDRQSSLVEAHAHRDGDPAAFSPSDCLGLQAFVPHVWWRLRHSPYVALVFAETTFDGLAWRADPRVPEPVTTLRVDGHGDRVATGRTGRRWQSW